MNIFIVYCHPSKTSFTYQVKEEFIRGLEAAGHTYTPSPTMKILKKALCIAIAGKSAESFVETKEGEAMEIVMLGDRIRNRATEKQMVILDGMSHWDENTRGNNLERHLKTAYNLGYHFMATKGKIE